MTAEQVIDPLVAPHAHASARLLHQAARAQRHVTQQPLSLSIRPGAAVIDPGSGASLMLAYCEHIIEPELWVTRLEMA